MPLLSCEARKSPQAAHNCLYSYPGPSGHIILRRLSRFAFGEADDTKWDAIYYVPLLSYPQRGGQYIADPPFSIYAQRALAVKGGPKGLRSPKGTKRRQRALAVFGDALRAYIAIYAPPPGRSAIYYVPLALPFVVPEGELLRRMHEQSGPEGRRAAQRGPKGPRCRRGAKQDSPLTARALWAYIAERPRRGAYIAARNSETARQRDSETARAFRQRSARRGPEGPETARAFRPIKCPEGGIYCGPRKPFGT